MFDSSCFRYRIATGPAVTCALHIRRQLLHFRLPFHTDADTPTPTHRQVLRQMVNGFLLAGGATQLSRTAAIYISLPISLLSASYTLYNSPDSVDAIFHLIYRTFYLCSMAPFYRWHSGVWAGAGTSWIAYFVIIILLSLCLPAAPN